MYSWSFYTKFYLMNYFQLEYFPIYGIVTGVFQITVMVLISIVD